MRRIVILCAALLSGCALELPPTCDAGYRIEAVSGGAWPRYVCRPMESEDGR